jgi:DNA polymerase V
MTARLPLDAIEHAALQRLPIPFIEGTVRGGFPSPALDFQVRRQDLNELLITHPEATFYWKVSGRSMAPAGIDEGDIIIVNRALKPVHMDIVVAEVDGDFTVKYLFLKGQQVTLKAADVTFPTITFKEGQQLVITGVVTDCIKRFRRR